MKQLTKDQARSIMNGSYLVGYVRATYNDLCDIIGFPISEPWDDNKTRVEWYLEFEDGTTATIYDYYSSGLTTKPYDWHIGGKNAIVATTVQNLVYGKNN